MICEHISPAHEVDGETVPAAPCDQTATMLARSMEQQRCNLGDVHWVKTDDKSFCPNHFVSGTMTHLDGVVTQHAAMSVNDA